MNEKTTILENEHILPDDYPVHWDYVYLCDGKPRFSPVGGGATVRELKHELSCTEIRNCDIVARGLSNMNCPACDKPMVNTLFFCGECWWKLPAKHRMMLYEMHKRRQDTDAKLAKCVKILKERHGQHKDC